MKRYLGWMIVFCSLGLPTFSAAQQALLLLSSDEQTAIYRAEQAGMRKLVDVGESVVYGQNESSLAVISRRTPVDPLLLQVVDKKTEKVTRTWTVPGFSVLRLSGPAPDVALTTKFAYYAAVRFGKDGTGFEPNELGGQYDLYRVSLADGRAERFSLDGSCANPRVILFEDTPLIYNWNGSAVWRFDPDRAELDAVVLSRDIQDTIMSEGPVDLRAVKPGSFADFVAISGYGLFRISRLGGLTHILDAKLARITASHGTLSLGSKGDVTRIFPATLAGQAMIGVLTTKGSERRYVAVSPTTMRVMREVVLPRQAVLDSVTVARDGSLVYVDQQAPAIRRMDGTDNQVLWTLQPGTAAGPVERTRIIYLDP